MTGSDQAGLPADAAARRRVVSSLEESVFVEAGAGSGKTASLVGRIANLVEAGTAVEHIAAITFTEAAATELRQRVRSELEERGRLRGGTAGRWLVDEAARTDRAAFTTVHGFAYRLLAEHPVEAGLPPGFVVADEMTSLLAFDEHWREFSTHFGDDPDQLELAHRAAILRLDLARMVDIARRLDDRWDLLERIPTDVPDLHPLDTGPVVAELVGLIELNRYCVSSDDRLAVRISDLAEAGRALLGLDPLDQLEALADLGGLRVGNAGRKASWTGVEVQEVRVRVHQVRDRIETLRWVASAEVLQRLLALVAGFVAERVAARRAAGELAFHDLLVLARDLLRDHPTVRARLSQQYRRILLDEFQDTDPIQIELAVLLAASDDPACDPAVTPWPDLAAAVPAGRLTVVGDPKQSIYRFRGADITVYRQTERALDPSPARLTTNFRSVPGIVEFVNAAFTALIGDGDGDSQPPFQPLRAHRSPDPDRIEPPVVVIGHPHDGANVATVRAAEAADVAAVVCRAVEEGWRVRDGSGWRPVRRPDIAVLIPSRLSLPSLESAFAAASVPFRPETSSLVYATQEIREVMAGVRAVADPESAIDVVAALRSALFNIGDDELVAWRQVGGRWDYRAPDQPADGAVTPNTVESPVAAVAAAMAVLRRWHRQRWWTTPSTLVDRIVRERRLRELALVGARPRDRWRRYRFLADQARRFEETTAGDLHRFVAWVEIQSSDLARVVEPIPPEPDDDAVRVLTMHGAKGLEFPMVIVAGAPTEDHTGRAGPQVLFPDDGPVEIKIRSDAATTNYDVHAAVEDVLNLAERVRLQYVATTRARDLLVVSCHHKASKQSAPGGEAPKQSAPRSSGARLWQAIGDRRELWVGFESGSVTRSAGPSVEQLELVGDDLPPARRRWLREAAAAAELSDRTAVTSATALAARLAPVWDASSRFGPPEEDGLAPARGSAGTAIGTAVHAVLQEIDFDRPDGLDRVAAVEANRQAVADQAELVAHLARAALDAPALALARRHPHWRELYVAAPVGEALVEGFIDLCIDGPDGLVVVDYKTDPVAGVVEADAKMAVYRIQAATYALALTEVTGRRVTDCRFVFVPPAGPIERPLTDLEAAVSEIRGLLTA
ncbi:MAG: UvrD-helicase domain-containing protein [Acidimicrobiales bacterium]